MGFFLFIFAAIFHVPHGGSIGSALDSARIEYANSGKGSTIYIAPGTYYEELTIDVPDVTFVNAAAEPSIGVSNGGVTADTNAVRISWYCGHGYQYRSMGGNFNYGGKRMRRWNAAVLVTAPRFTAENIIFENSFNLYISPAELSDSLADISQAAVDWTVNERPKKVMPARPRELWSTEVQQARFTERAAALSFVSGATDARLVGCRITGKQDVLYGDHGASLVLDGGVVQGTVDYIFGGMDVTVRNAELVIGSDDGKKECYIAAGRGFVVNSKTSDGQERVRISSDSLQTEYGMVPADEVAAQGMVFVGCTVRYATPDELLHPGAPLVYLARPWRWWGRHSFISTNTEAVRMAEPPVSLGLTKGRQAPYVEVTK